jgi:hypothetical protein
VLSLSRTNEQGELSVNEDLIADLAGAHVA